MSDTAKRAWRFYLDDMIGFAERVIAYTDELDQAGFVVSGLHYDATVRNLELIGEGFLFQEREILRCGCSPELVEGQDDRRLLLL